MAEQSQSLIDVLPEQWVEEVRQLSRKVGKPEICVRVMFPGGVVSAIGFQPQVDEQEIHILLRPQSPSGSSNADIYVSLPKFDEGWYRMATSETGEKFLCVAFPACGMDLPVNVELQLATSWEFLSAVTKTTRVQ